MGEYRATTIQNAAVCKISRALSIWLKTIVMGGIAGAVLGMATTACATQPSVAFFYGSHPPPNVLRDFDWVVIQPSALKTPGDLATSGSTVFGYVSLGEIDRSTPTSKTLPTRCRAGEDRPWNSWIVNQADPVCRAFYLKHVFEPLRARGYRNFFLDNLDSYWLTTKSQSQRVAYRRGLIALIKAVHNHDPDGHFILNRGFSLLPALKDDGVVAVAAESLYRGWNQGTKKYVAVKPASTRRLLNEFSIVRREGMTPIAIDYLPAAERKRAEQLARRIEAQGIVPYVGTAMLRTVGVGTIAPIPRQILLLYNGPDTAMNSDVNMYASMPLNHMGYATRTIDVSRQALPAGTLAGQIAGIVTWFNSDHFRNSSKVWAWLHRQMRAGIRVAVLGTFGVPPNDSVLDTLGLRSESPSASGISLAKVNGIDRDYFGFETPLLPSTPDFYPLALARGTPLLTVSVAGRDEVAAALAPWGGYVLAPYVLRSLPQGALGANDLQAAWILDPFRFFRAALRLPNIPAFDYTTDSGQRILFSIIDGDGFSSKSWIGAFRDQRAGRVILDQVLRKFELPVSASVIASEFTDDGLYPPAEVKALQRIARKIFLLPWVEIGTHTYSHPFDWSDLERSPGLSAGLNIEESPRKTDSTSVDKHPEGLKYGYNLPIPGYRFNPEMEVTGSAEIINRLLAPPGKHVKIIQWSGDANPDALVLAIARRDGIANINGNNSTITRSHPSLTNVAPLGVWKGAYFQVYSPIANEDEYTDGWKPPYCGYSRVIQTLEMTNRPRRLTPMEIYYHYYSGTRACALKSLIGVERWTLKQPSIPLFASTYSQIATAFESAGLAAIPAGFALRNYGADQEIRVPERLGYPDFNRSVNIAGYDTFGGQRYIHLGPGGQARLVLQAKAPSAPYLANANGEIEGLQRTKTSLTLRLRGTVPLKASFRNTAGCTVKIDGRPYARRTRSANQVHIRLQAHEVTISVRCIQ